MELKTNFNWITMIHLEQGHTIKNETIVYTCQTNLNAVGMVKINTISIILYKRFVPTTFCKILYWIEYGSTDCFVYMIHSIGLVSIPSLHAKNMKRDAIEDIGYYKNFINKFENDAK